MTAGQGPNLLRERLTDTVVEGRSPVSDRGSYLVSVRNLLCETCGYDLHGLGAEHVCPECGCDVSRTIAATSDGYPSRLLKGRVALIWATAVFLTVSYLFLFLKEGVEDSKARYEELFMDFSAYAGIMALVLGVLNLVLFLRDRLWFVSGKDRVHGIGPTDAVRDQPKRP